MAGPLIAAAVRGAPAAFRAASGYIATRMAQSGAPIAAVAARLGLKGGKATVDGILAAVRNNKTMTALVLYELGAEALPYLVELAESDTEVAQIYNLLSAQTPDNIDEIGARDIGLMADEFMNIETGIRVCGGYDRWFALRESFRYADSTIIAHRQQKELSKIFR